MGSFLNVVIYRLPRGLSVVSPPSSCPNCGLRLRWWQLIPVFSYLFQHGKCSFCHSGISLRYPLVELVTGGLFLGIYLIFGFDWVTLIYWILIASLISVTLIDWEHMIIPDELNLVIFVTGLAASILQLTIPISQALIGSLLGGCLLFMLAVLSRGGMGGGDIKLAFALGVFTGWQLMLFLLFLASLLGTVYGLGQIAFQGTEKGRKIPFGPFISIAGIIALFGGQQIIQYYLAIF
ncbi:MAG: prepilin peptidase [Clostridia bacterium]|nr:prepilin peptidase [Clostridia bacterium]